MCVSFGSHWVFPTVFAGALGTMEAHQRGSFSISHAECPAILSTKLLLIEIDSVTTYFKGCIVSQGGWLLGSDQLLPIPPHFLKSRKAGLRMTWCHSVSQNTFKEEGSLWVHRHVLAHEYHMPTYTTTPPPTKEVCIYHSKHTNPLRHLSWGGECVKCL